MRNLNRIFIVIILALLSACDTINKEPYDKIAESNFWRNGEDAQAAIIGVYDKIQSRAGQNPVALDASADAVTVLTVTDGYLDFNKQSISVDNIIVDTYWNNTYAGIHRVNDILKEVPNIHVPAFSDSKKAELLGEAHFLRAFFYFGLVVAYGDVPLVTKPYDTFNTDFTIEKTPANQVYELIISDLKQAEATLPANYADAFQTRGRATSGTAKALLAKVYLFTKDYENAADKAAEVIANPLYSLVTGTTNYTNMFTPSGKNGTEAIFEIQFVGLSAEGHGLNARFMPLANAGQIGGNLQIVPSAKILAAYNVGDIRKPASIGVSTNPPFRRAGEIYVKKYVRLSDGSDPNIIALRLADIILVKAEALNELGLTAEAIDNLNIIRRRAFSVPLNIASVYDYPNTFDIAKGFDLGAAIANERFVELAFEGHRWEDLKRTGKAAAELAIDVKKTWWPIPQREINRNPRLIQNLGY